jgi:PilZ domain
MATLSERWPAAYCRSQSREDQVSSTTLADLPDAMDLVDVTLDSRSEPLAAVISAITGDIVLLKEPMDRTGHLVLPEAGEQGLLVWGGGSSLRQAPIEVLGTNRRPIATWLVRLTAPAMRCQRRSFVRANVNLPVVVRLTDADFEVTAVDLSEGGMRCHTRAEVALTTGDSLTAEFNPGRHQAASATVVRLRRGTEERPAELGLWFTGLNMSDADNIRRYVFSQLLEQRRRGES